MTTPQRSDSDVTRALQRGDVVLYNGEALNVWATSPCGATLWLRDEGPTRIVEAKAFGCLRVHGMAVAWTGWLIS